MRKPFSVTRRVATIGLVATLSGVVGAAPSFAKPATVPEKESQVSFAISAADVELPRNSKFQINELSQYGIPKSAIEKIHAKVSESSTSNKTEKAQPQASNRYTVVGEWQDTDGWRVVMRQGWSNGTGGGFGLTKVTEYHNLTMDFVRALTTYTENKTHVNGKKYNYQGYSYYLVCEGPWPWSDCIVEDRITIIAGVDFEIKRGSDPFGVVTAYCEGHRPRCPDWVKNSIPIPTG